MRAFAVLAVLCLALSLVAGAEDAGLIPKEGGKADGSEQLGHLDGMHFHPLFPLNEDLRFVAGQPAELLIGVVNSLDRYINVTYVEASLRNVLDDSEFAQNFTRHPYFINLPGKGTSVAIDFQFKPDSMLDAVAYAFVVQVHYLDGTANHTEVVFNGTVTITEPEETLINTETVFLVLGGAAALAGVAYLLVTRASKRKVKKVRDSNEEAAAKDAWLEGTIAANKKSPKKKTN